MATALVFPFSHFPSRPRNAYNGDGLSPFVPEVDSVRAMSFFWATLLLIILASAWVLTLVGMPGNWVMVAAVIVYVLLVPVEATLGIGWPVAIALVVLATLGEILEFAAGALGVAKAGGSRRGAVFALVGSLAGAMVGLVVGAPIPVVGSLIAAVLLAGVGALIGAMLGEQGKGRGFDESWKIGKAAFWGRLLGTAAKTVLGAVMVAVAVVALIA